MPEQYPIIQFCGASDMVTGSCYHITTESCQFLVDCGLFQGHKTVKDLNYRDFNFIPSDIDFVLLTHAHIDHSGLLPKLYKAGFNGKVFTTEATADLLSIMLPDSAHIQQNEVKYVNRKNRQRGLQSVTPIYDIHHAQKCLDNLTKQTYKNWFHPASEISVRFWNAGHILGSSSIEISIQTKEQEKPLSLLFSGDIGPDEKSFHPDPDAPKDCDYLFIETTYGSRDRTDKTLEQRRDILKSEIELAMRAGGNLIIPSFAIERTQELLPDISLLLDEKLISPLRLFLDSPLAVKATEVFKLHKQKLKGVTADQHPFSGNHLTLLTETAESKALNNITSGAVIMAASGMCDAGRIRHHLKNNLWNPAATVLFVGYQAPGTLGNMLLNGKKNVRIHGQEIQVRANIRQIDCYSAHADQGELCQWIKDRLPVHKSIFLTHGENTSRTAFRDLLVEQGIEHDKIIMPHLDDTFQLTGAKAPTLSSSITKRPIDKSIAAPIDWHNEYAQFLLQLAEKLRQLPTADDRHDLLEKLEQSVDKY